MQQNLIMIETIFKAFTNNTIIIIIMIIIEKKLHTQKMKRNIFLDKLL